MMFLLHIFALCATVIAGGPKEITSLPGWDKPLPSKMYSGFANAGTAPNGKSQMHMHYIFIESESSPEKDPVVVWYNGGPGAASMFGMLVELGPLMLNDASLDDNYKKTGVPTLINNPFSWSKISNLLIVNSPPPVGFSYCDSEGPSGNGLSCGPWNDSLVAKANHVFLTGLFKNDLPQFSHNPLYITGESYAGVYVPTIVREILADPQGLNLVGFAVGDGCMGTDVLCGEKWEPYYDIEFMHGHAQMSERQYRKINSVCTDKELHGDGVMSLQCKAEVDKGMKAVGGYYAYNLYDDCVYQEPFMSSKNRKWWSTVPSTHFSVSAAENDYPCPGPAMNIWLNLTQTREALHVPKDSFFFSGDDGEGFNYTSTEKNLLPFYADLIRNNTLRVLVYNGDTDPGINSFVTQDKYTQYFDSVGLKETDEWRPWTLDGNKRMGGYVLRYENNWDFITIRGSGHMVPEFKPEAAFKMLQSFLNNEAPLPYKP